MITFPRFFAPKKKKTEIGVEILVEILVSGYTDLIKCIYSISPNTSVCSAREKTTQSISTKFATII